MFQILLGPCENWQLLLGINFSACCLQVVELPKEAPEAPLQLFADVPNLQILVMGGDGTAGWILSCLDAMQEQRAAGAECQAWAPPPVAVLPLGTGTCACFI